MDIVVPRKAQNGYSVRVRLFELLELQLLIDAVDALSIHHCKKRAELVKELTALISSFHSEDLILHLYIGVRVKPALFGKQYSYSGQQRKRISFCYSEYNAQKIFQTDG